MPVLLDVLYICVSALRQEFFSGSRQERRSGESASLHRIAQNELLVSRYSGISVVSSPQSYRVDTIVFLLNKNHNMDILCLSIIKTIRWTYQSLCVKFLSKWVTVGTYFQYEKTVVILFIKLDEKLNLNNTFWYFNDLTSLFVTKLKCNMHLITALLIWN